VGVIEMDKELLFKVLAKQPKPVLLDALHSAYNELNTSQKRWIFGKFVEKHSSPVDGKKLLKDVQKFEQDSLTGRYYAPFSINSKNFMHIPEETEEWFERLGDLLKESVKLTQQKENTQAVECFSILFKLITEMEKGEEIVFAHELGSWMIPGGEKRALAAYIASLAKTKSPEDFTAVVLPFVKRDSYHSFSDRVYTSANRFASKEQKAHLNAELKRQQIPTGPKSKRARK
jgi:hypothetical protein